MTSHEQYMKRCLELALLGKGKVAPNPLVGAVIVHHNQIIGEGYHESFGGNHAEINAINSVSDKNLLKDSSLYVNLEPCNHHGKTPPCIDAISKYDIRKVFIGCTDPNPNVSGKGIQKLLDTDCLVKVGILEKESIQINKRFFTFYEKKRPYIILKWAQTKDGFIAKNDRKRTWITGELTKKLVHQWRSNEMAIMVGTNTAIIDNPSLDVRHWEGTNPIRIVIDKDLKLDKNLNLFNEKAKTIVFNNLQNHPGEKITYIKIDFLKKSIPQILHSLYELNIQSAIIEGGKVLLDSFIAENSWDEARILTAPIEFKSGISAPFIKGKIQTTTQIGMDILTVIKNQ